MTTEKDNQFEAVDLQSRKILEFIAAINVELPLEVLLKEKKDNFEQSLNDLVVKMLQANSHLRNYRIESKKTEKDFKKKVNSDKSRKTQDIIENVNGLYDHFQSYLKGNQSVLDQLAVVLDHTIDSKFGTWKISKTEEGQVLSGKEILDYLKGLPKEQQDKMVNLAEVIEQSMDPLSYLAELNQMNLSDVILDMKYDHQLRTIVPVQIKHTDGQVQNLLDFMDNLMSYLINFLVGVLLRALSYNSPGFVILRTADQRGIVAYRAIPIDLLKNKMHGDHVHTDDDHGRDHEHDHAEHSH
jgi:hypothetical protein